MGSALLVAGRSFLLGCLERGSCVKTVGVADGRDFSVCWEVVLRCNRFSSAGRLTFRFCSSSLGCRGWRCFGVVELWPCSDGVGDRGLGLSSGGVAPLDGLLGGVVFVVARGASWFGGKWSLVVFLFLLLVFSCWLLPMFFAVVLWIRRGVRVGCGSLGSPTEIVGKVVVAGGWLYWNAEDDVWWSVDRCRFKDLQWGYKLMVVLLYWVEIWKFQWLFSVCFFWLGCMDIYRACWGELGEK